MQAFVLIATLVLVCSGAAAAQSDSGHEAEPIGTVRQVYDGALMPDIQVNTFRNIDRLFATRDIRRGNRVYPLPAADTQLTDVRIQSGGRAYDLYDYVSLNRVSGLLAIKDGQIVHESYHLGNSDKTHWMSMSIAKSISATLVGIAIKDGFIGGIDDPVTDYVTGLRGSAYDGVTVRHLLQMASGVRWNETYTDPTSDRRRLLEAQIAQEPGGMMKVMAGLPRAADPGTRWNYSTGDTQIVAALIRAATSRHAADYLSQRIWARFGMESDATWWLDSPDGEEVGGSGISATLRDYGRFGLFLLNDGVVDGQSLLPDGWQAEAGSAKIINGQTVDYGYMFWPFGDGLGPVHKGAYAAVGIFGQRLYINPRENIVIVVWSARPKPIIATSISDYDFFAALIAAVR